MAFHEIAVPHKDILSRNFSSEVYAASLWDVYMGRGPDVYADAKAFFDKTYITDNLRHILDSVGDRLAGRGGGHFRSLSTPFGGGKTHTMIALYHKCKEWKAKPVVMVGTAMNPKKQTLWGAIEEQLTGRITRLDGQEAPGSEALRNVLAMQNQPVLILIDELLQYITKADAVSIDNTTLAKLTIAFIQELSEAISTLNNVCVVVTLPSSANEQLDDERFAQLDARLKKVASRTRDTLIPVSDDDIPRIIRRRLFSTTDSEIRQGAESVVKDFVDYCEDEGLIPEGWQASEYREKFLDSYPFLPQVINVLYERWGTITTFQRTRGVLRLLSLVVGSLATTDKQFITLGDFALNNDTIRHELVEYLDPQFNGVIAKDITGYGSGASKVNQMVPDKYKGKKLGTRTAAAIFMHSHSGGAEIGGATESELKRATCERGIPAAQISVVLARFKEHLFYLSTSNDRYMFTKDTNILKLKVDIMDNLNERELEEAEKALVKRKIGKTKELKLVLWPSESRDVKDTAPLKLVIMKKNDDLIKEIHDKCGDSDRIRRNNIFFLVPSSGEKTAFVESLKNKVAWEKIMRDPSIKIDTTKKSMIKTELEKADERLVMLVGDYYSTLYVPEKDGLELNRLRASPVTDSGLDQIAYDHLVETEAVSPNIGVLTLKTRYLGADVAVETLNVLNTMLSVQGELRPISTDVLKKTIEKGVLDGEFELGHIVNGQLVVKHSGDNTSPCFEQGEVIVPSSMRGEAKEKHVCEKCGYEAADEDDLLLHIKSHRKTPDEPDDSVTRLDFAFDIPEGHVNNASKILLRIASSFKDLRLEIKADSGKMTRHDIDMIREALSQMGARSNLR